MARFRIHTSLTRHTGQKTGTVRSCTTGALINAPPGEFADLAPGHDYTRVDQSSSATPEDTTEDADDPPTAPTTE